MLPIRKTGLASEGAAPAQPVIGVRIREIGTADLAAVAALLTRGFPFRREDYWLRGLERHAARPRPAGCPAFGYCLDHGGTPVGVILLLFSEVQCDGVSIVRANVSSWYVEAAFRAFSSMLVRAATRDKTVTYFNITPAPHTWPQVEAQGFSVYCRGQIYAALALSPPKAGVTIGEFAESNSAGLSAYDVDLLRQHADWGCLSMVVHEAGISYPFVFQKHRVKNWLPVYRLLYVRDMADVARFAGAIGRFLLRRGGLLVRLDANAPMTALVGWYSERRGRKYAKGPHPPDLGDLAFTEAALFDA
ncbi:acyl-CoA acyltransferase [Bradyrhizobium aeschynomenes]|uniref:acyl-CoA acyltransferase n=1 Tax=Bradyrhizobium aeschynomenes TaxID=2734909 RepID=UPI0015562D43|nr:acyl-CoA acyltransferase [Bradyrhizobium aeschynomenes]